MSISNPVLYPQVTRLPSQTEVAGQGQNAGGQGIQKGEFDQALNQAMGPTKTNELNEPSKLNPALGAGLNTGIKFSAHAMQRLNERNIRFDPETMSRMNEAINKASSKGVQDTLVLTQDAALIVSVPNRTVITAMDRNNLSGNVFTNIDGAVII